MPPADTAPLIDPPEVSVASIPVTVEPFVTETGVAAVLNAVARYHCDA